MRALGLLCRLEWAAVVTVTLLTLAPRQIGIMYVCVKGLLNSTLGLVKLSYCKKTLHIDGNACQTMGSIAMTPWSIKGVFGVLSDSYVSLILLSVLCALAVLMARGIDTCVSDTLTTTCDIALRGQVPSVWLPQKVVHHHFVSFWRGSFHRPGCTTHR